MCKSLLVFYCNYVFRTVSAIFSVKEWRDFEILVSGRLRSLKMAPFDRPHTTYCQSAIVTITLSCIISEIQRNIGRKLRFFSYRLHSTPSLGGLCRSIAIPFDMEQERSYQKQIARQLRTHSSIAGTKMIPFALS